MSRSERKGRDVVAVDIAHVVQGQGGECLGALTTERELMGPESAAAVRRPSA